MIVWSISLFLFDVENEWYQHVIICKQIPQAYIKKGRTPIQVYPVLNAYTN